MNINHRLTRLPVILLLLALGGQPSYAALSRPVGSDLPALLAAGARTPSLPSRTVVHRIASLMLAARTVADGAREHSAVQV